MAKKSAKKSKATEQKAAKQSKKAAQKQSKARKGADDSDADDVDIETVLEEYAQKQAQYLRVTEAQCDPPSPTRVSATFIGSPSNAKELLLFGGESFDGTHATFYNDLFVYNIDKDEWRRVTSPNSPLPRSGHAWCRGGNVGNVYLFGGEFSSPKQGTFFHYSDFWMLDPATREWSKLEVKGKSPPARSGHRMTYFKEYIIIFGGFQDTSQQTRYLNDCWVYDTHNFVWHNLVPAAVAQKPDPRSSFSLHPQDGGAALFGGYSRTNKSSKPLKNGKMVNPSSKNVLKPHVHDDAWHLRLTPPANPSAAVGPQIRWERRKRPVNTPNPARAGATQVFHKGRGILFGGVHDTEDSEEGIDSEFFNELCAWNIDRNRFYKLVLRRPRATARRPVEDKKKSRGKADEAELLRNLAALETNRRIEDADDLDLGSSEDDEPMRPAKPVSETLPRARFNALLAIQKDLLFIYGGTVEQGDREYNFDEMHSIDLGKLDGVQEVHKREQENWVGEEEEEEEEEDDDDDESDYEDEMDVDDDDGDDDDDKEKVRGIDEAPVAQKPSEGLQDQETAQGLMPDAEEIEPDRPVVEDFRPQPRPFESLRAFFTRTTVAWQDLVMKELIGSGDQKSIKELRKIAFGNAETRWWDLREEVIIEEERLEEAGGIGEVVSLADVQGNSGPNRRR